MRTVMTISAWIAGISVTTGTVEALRVSATGLKHLITTAPCRCRCLYLTSVAVRHDAKSVVAAATSSAVAAPSAQACTCVAVRSPMPFVLLRMGMAWASCSSPASLPRCHCRLREWMSGRRMNSWPAARCRKRRFAGLQHLLFTVEFRWPLLALYLFCRSLYSFIPPPTPPPLVPSGRLRVCTHLLSSLSLFCHVSLLLQRC